ncbi:NosL domain-containing protein [Aliarcobacter faecis]|uniref:nitrous oxide reductase accessory protein NosL n=1 Tax=Aliarcobacter faecis TaxID=1564138 RepID=UPI00047B16FA|nr:nitrous oxide reductase accessory protein NosL [Aliarcobacter faecis]QKF73095.1 NosL domain-containing protein [Aliarcobacter faecis]
MKKIFFLLIFICVSIFGADILSKEYKDLNLKQDMCPVKNVPIEKHKDWLGYVEFNDGKIIALSSPKYSFAYYLKELNHNKNENIKAIYVTDFKTKKIIDAKTAYYVFGSNLMSVGGDDVIPFELESDAKEFFDTKHGKQIYRFDRMTENFINYLDMR